MTYIAGHDRSQKLLLPESLDEYVGAENPVRFIDAWVDGLDLTAAGFDRMTAKATGRPGYPPRDLLKLYIYGYLNRVRSSRRLEAETHRNIEVIWLLRHLKPDLACAPKELKVITPDGRDVFPSHHAFGQLCQLGKAGRATEIFRGQPSWLAALNLQYQLSRNVRDEPVKIYGGGDEKLLRAATGPDYGRIFDADVVQMAQRFAGSGTGDTRWKVPGVLDCGAMKHNPFVDVTKETTTLFASDRDVFVFLCDDTRPIEIGTLANGDPDMIFRGFFVQNSEVGTRSLKIATFWLRAVCQNRNLWGVEDFDELTIIHSKFGAERAGGDLRGEDWGTASARRAKKDPPSKGGWNLFHTSANGAQLASPLTSPSTITTCDGKNFVGWPCDQVEEDMRIRYIRETDPEKRQALLEQMHIELWKSLPYVPLGQFKQPFVWRNNISGLVKANTLVYWNIEKT